jgi:pyroglutamyl-peptidase
MNDAARTVLLTGFEPFDADLINPSWEAVRALEGWRCVDAVVRVRQMPCVFGASIEALKKAIADTNPQLIVCVGLAGGCSELSVERVAVNVDDARIVDNAGNQPIDASVVQGGPVAYFSTLPIKAIVRDLRAAGIPASVSSTAGNFVCNHVFYGLMHQLACAKPTAENELVRGGFIHVPYLPEQAARFAPQPSMALDVAVAGLRIAVATALVVKHDVKQVGGRLH